MNSMNECFNMKEVRHAYAYIVTGTLTNERTVTLDEALPLPVTRVRLVIEPLGSAFPPLLSRTRGSNP